MKNVLLSILLFNGFLFSSVKAQLPCNVLVGYYQTSWGAYVPLASVNSNYNVFCLSFLEAGGGDGIADNNNVNALSFFATNDAKLRADIPVVQAQGKKVLISIGGGLGSFKLNSANDKTTFVNKVKNVITSYGLDGIDIDLERPVYLSQTNGGTISNPEPHIQYMIDGIKELLSWYQTTYSKKMILTFVPEVAYTTGGLSSYLSSTYGVAYLPMIEALKNDLDLLMVQFYNTGAPVVALNNAQYAPGTADFIVSQVDALVQGFTCKNGKGVFSGVSPSQIAVCLPASAQAGGGYFSTSVVSAAMAYLRGEGPKPGSYTLVQSGGYPEIRGLATWSINMDLISGNTFATNYSTIFTNCLTTGNDEINVGNNLLVYPNPASNMIHFNLATPELVNIYDELGSLIVEKNIGANESIDISTLSSGLYFVRINAITQKVLVQK